MKIAIVGKAGTGKTTFTRLIDNKKCVIINLDDIINNIYTNLHLCNNVLEFFIENFKPCVILEAYSTMVNKNYLANILSKNSKKRIKLENFLYKEVLKPYLDSCDGVDLIVDGVLPRFTKDFDLVLYAHVPEAERKRRLKKRGVSSERIKQIDEMQKDFYKVFKEQK